MEINLFFVIFNIIIWDSVKFADAFSENLASAASLNMNTWIYVKYPRKYKNVHHITNTNAIYILSMCLLFKNNIIFSTKYLYTNQRRI